MQRTEFDRSLWPWLRLAHAKGVGALRLARLLDGFGSADAVLAQSLEVLADRLGSGPLAHAVLASPPELAAYAETVFSWLNAAHDGAPDAMRAVWPISHPCYPPALRELQDPPPLLYVVGGARWLAGWPADATVSRAAANPQGMPPWWALNTSMLAVVGSRQPTAQGAASAQRLAAEVRQSGVCVVSGLARGIDAAAHEGALQAVDGPGDGPATVAVMGTGADRLYPAYHKALAQRIAAHGLLMTEQPLGAPPLATHFPKRNRIITGMCPATLVVEATEKSGSLISARLAVEQGRDVLAVPGSILSPQSKGCHWLIKQGAKLVDAVQDILEELAPASMAAASPVPWARAEGESVAASQPAAAGPGPLGRVKSTGAQSTQSAPDNRASKPRTGLPRGRPVPAGESRHAALVAALGFDPVTLEELGARTGLPTALLQAQLLELELQGQVARLPGGVFQRVGQA